MKRTAVSSFAVAAGLLALCLAPAFAQERPSPQGHGGGEHAAPRSGGGGSSGSSPSGSGGSSSPSSGGSSVGSSGGGGGGGGGYVNRSGGREGRRGTSGGTARSRTGSPKPVIVPSGSGAGSTGEGGLPNREPNAGYSRPRAGRPVTGAAVPRDISGVPPSVWPGPIWPWYPYWGGSWFYYDPYWWDYYYGYGYPSYGYGVGVGYGYSEGDYDTGSLKLKVRPRDAQVYVDGYFSGVVDDYDGTFQRLRLRSGGHRIEIRADGLQPAIFDVLIVAGETVTYRAELKPKS